MLDDSNTCKRLAEAVLAIAQDADSGTATAQALRLIAGHFDSRSARFLERAACEIGGEAYDRTGRPPLPDDAALQRIGAAMARGKSQADAVAVEARAMEHRGGKFASHAARLREKLNLRKSKYAGKQ
ncbi:MAG TPA: hypothetical protein VNU97_15290 [Rhizomicrobium sp.]|jgi:hypothetical protein|nr:hypothetical protein [Rhizomicrobium sp.]